MSRLICKQAYRKPGDKREKIMCKVSGLICAHSYFCPDLGKYKHLDSAFDCPGKDGKQNAG